MKHHMCLQCELNGTCCSVVFLKLQPFEGGMSSFFLTNRFLQAPRIHGMHLSDQNYLGSVCAEHVSTTLCLK